MSSEYPPSPGKPSPAPPSTGSWEREVITRLAFAALNEQRRSRRWSLVFKFALLAYLIALLVLYLPFELSFLDDSGKHTALVDIQGTISPTSDASADRIATGLRAAFEDSDTTAVIVRINSPGGSPVQAGTIYDEIRRLREKHRDIPVYAVIQDVCASGGYYVAAAAEKIYADKGSVVGSIGVMMSAFGFVDAMEDLGIERRLITAGENKGLLDPFSPLDERHVAHVKTLLESIHQQFIDVVRAGRGERMANDPRLFSGLIWTGEQSVELGLVDALGSASYVAREVVGQEKIVDFTVKPRFVDRLARGIGASMAGTVSRNLGLGGALELR